MKHNLYQSYFEEICLNNIYIKLLYNIIYSDLNFIENI